MKSRILLSIVLLLISIPAWAQFPMGGGSSLTGKISGELVDSLTQSPLAYASISLFKGKKKKPDNGTLSDENGRFKLSGVKMGTYSLHITSLGYQTKIVEAIKLTPEKPDVNLEAIQVVAVDLQLDEVEIVSERPIIENKVDRIVYNAEQDITTAGGDATQVLRKVPMVTVDLEGNVSLRGNSNLRVLINGKPSGMFASSVKDALKMIPADQIKSVEVITTPSAKYDAEGSGGIINIITKKKRIEGVSGFVNASAGNVQNSLNLNLNINRGRFGVNGTGYLFHAWPREALNSFLREDEVNGQVRVLQQNGSGQSGRFGFGGRMGLYYDFNAYNSLSSNINGGGFSFGRDGTTDAIFTDPALNINQSYRQIQETFSLYSTYDWNTDYVRTTKKKDQEFSIGVQVSGNVNNTDISLDQQGNDPLLTIVEQSLNKGNNLEITLQTDYTHPFNKKTKLEIGAKGILRDIDSDYNYEVFQPDENRFVVDPFRSNVFDYDQNVYAGYASLSLKFAKKYSLVAGARYEFTEIGGDFATGGDPFSNTYSNLLPSIILSRKVKKFSNLKLSFVQRIQRPSLFYINPFVNQADRRNIVFGNPKLRPELTDQYEIGYNTIFKKINLNMAVYYRRTRDIIESVLNITEQGITTTTFQNVGVNNSFGANIFANFTVKKFWVLRGNLNLYTYDATGTINGQRVSNTAWMYNANLNSSFIFKHGFRVELFGLFNSPRQTLQGTNASFSLYTMAIQKEIFKKKGSLGLALVEPFHATKNFDSEFEGSNFYQLTGFSIPFRSIGLNFSYRFGKLDFTRMGGRRSKIKNDDQKEGETNNF